MIIFKMLKEKGCLAASSGTFYSDESGIPVDFLINGPGESLFCVLDSFCITTRNFWRVVNPNGKILAGKREKEDPAEPVDLIVELNGWKAEAQII